MSSKPYKVIAPGEIPRSPKGTVSFEGKDHGSGVSIFMIEYDEVGFGPGLHKHPYPETWILQKGRARFTAGDDVMDAGPGTILVVDADTPHMFKNLGPETLDIICIHPSPTFIQENLE